MRMNTQRSSIIAIKTQRSLARSSNSNTRHADEQRRQDLGNALIQVVYLHVQITLQALSSDDTQKGIKKAIQRTDVCVECVSERSVSVKEMESHFFVRTKFDLFRHCCI